MKRATLLLLPLALAGLLALRFATELSWVFAASLLFWHYFAFGVLVTGGLSFICLKRWRAPLIVISGAVIASYFSPLISDMLKNPSHKDRAVYKVISYNWLFSSSDRSAFYAWLAVEDPDILSIQEFNKKDLGPLLASQPRAYFVSETRDDVVILSRFPLSEDKLDKVGSRRLVSATANLPSGAVRVFGAHAPTLRDIDLLTQRNSYLARLPELIARSDKPQLVMGDFNATPWEPLVARLKSKAGLHEAPRLVPLSTRMAVRRQLDVGSPIDHIMASHTVHLRHCRTGPVMASDHRPLICEFSI
ncbi:endonuclease/exonuclease/phosphatase family protein [Asticcacaulis excentricus]|uniref:Endonuclease/exonuclease/phosphatase n=1 Tax=Asticcacaulis excentricus (strain ATCC 15261 / DSM 4724 / KCTC 12464 / NCIMB 9791 / VKM B-1370 / CB 48) TaxID=573065 RepID=E8RMC7_ASTEC|nr:endonuclease/exonuclease/phosphatase family protein [Asticcacaulis excentricus]ADU13878.1 Endonuclease/exonuclease/phosphatase [Asticcacaulis excentricus CB 48]